MRHLNRTLVLILTGLIGLIVLVGINVVAGMNVWRVDLTADKLFSLSPQSVAVLKDLKKDVNAVAFYFPNSPGRQAMKDMLTLCARQSDHFTFEFVDPDRDPGRAKEYKFRGFPGMVMVSGRISEKVKTPSEEDVINSILRVTDPKVRKIYFVEGHGEQDIHSSGKKGMSKIKDLIREQGMEVGLLPLGQLSAIPEDAEGIAIIGPKTNFLDKELQLLKEFVDKGGRLLVAFSAEDKTNLDDFVLERLSILRMDGLVVDTNSLSQFGDVRIPVAQQYGEHPITQDFGELVTMYPTAVALRTKILPGSEADTRNAWIQHLARSSHTAWAETDLKALNENATAIYVEGEDTKGPLPMVASYEIKDPIPDPENPEATKPDEGPKPRAVVFGDQDFFTNQYIQAGGNKDLARNALNWLMERESILSLVKTRENIFMLLRPYQKDILTWVPRLGVPLAALIMAAAVTLIRRPRKRQA